MLLLSQLNQAGQRKAIVALLPDCTSQLLHLLAGDTGSSGGQPFLGSLLEVVLTKPSG